MDALELVPEDVSPRELRDELDLRTSRAGYTTRDGRRPPRKIRATVNFGQTRLNVWPRDENGRLVEAS